MSTYNNTFSLGTFLKDSDYKLSQFTQKHIERLENIISFKANKKGIDEPYVHCLGRDKSIKLTPEEAVRQLYLCVLIDDLGYPKDRIQIEYSVSFGREKKRADIVIMDKDRPQDTYIIVELKKPKLKDGKEQLKSYCNATGAPMGVWTNGDSISYYHRKDPNFFEDISAIPDALHKLSDILTDRWSLDDLVKKDKLVNERKSLKDLILEMEDEVLANAGVDVFEELFKLIFTKLYDEMESGRNKSRFLEFRNYGDTESELKAKIQALFDKASKKWEGVFSHDAKLLLTASHLSVCVSSLQDVKLFNSNLDVVDEAFEYLINKSSKGEKGQYFTPRYVIDMCVKMLNPQASETLIDTAAGSCGFPVHGIFHVWEQILKEKGLEKSHLFTTEVKPTECTDYVQDKVFAIDFDERAVRVARTLNLIAGDGQTNVLHLNTLDYERWDEKTTDETWLDAYGEGWKKLRRMRSRKDSNQNFEFDILMANPPFAGEIKESRILAKYELGKKPDGKYQTKVGRDILFIERNLDFLKSGGRMAVVLPQGRFNNSSDKMIRDFIAERCRILAVVGLHGNVFKPHTGTKTSVLLVQKWDDTLCPRVADYPIFFATMQEPSKDNSGEKIILRDAEGLSILDSHGHQIVKHDLFNHDGKTQAGLQKLLLSLQKGKTFFCGKDLSPFDQANYQALLEGLEISVLSLSEVLADNLTKRIDSEYFRKQFLDFFKNVKNINPLSYFVKEGYRVVYENTKIIDATIAVEKQYPIFLQAIDLKTPFIKTNNFCYVHNDEWIRYPKGRIKNGEILIEVKGKVEKVAIVPNDFPEKALVTGSLFKLSVNQNINKHVLLTYLISSYGVAFKDRYKTNLLISFISKPDLYRIPVPNFSKYFQSQIDTLFISIFSFETESKSLYAEAESLLLQEIGLNDFVPSTDNINVKSFADSFGTSGRLDAEYYQPKYEDYEKTVFLKSDQLIRDNFDLIKTVRKIKKSYHYIEIGDIDVSTGSASYNVVSREELPTNAKIMAQKGDLLVSKVRPNRGAVAIIDFEVDELIVSGAFTVLRAKKNANFSCQLLQVLLRTSLYKDWLLKFNIGTQYPVIKDDDILSLPIPKLEISTQNKIKNNIREAQLLQNKSERLLEVAKQAVEIAIEQDENVATTFIDKNHNFVNQEI